MTITYSLLPATNHMAQQVKWRLASPTGLAAQLFEHVDALRPVVLLPEHSPVYAVRRFTKAAGGDSVSALCALREYAELDVALRRTVVVQDLWWRPENDLPQLPDLVKRIRVADRDHWTAFVSDLGEARWLQLMAAPAGPRRLGAFTRSKPATALPRHVDVSAYFFSSYQDEGFLIFENDACQTRC